MSVALTPAQIWQQALEQIRHAVNKATFETWFRPTLPISLDGDKFIVEIPNQYFSEWVEGRYLSLIKNALREVTGRPIEIEYQVAQQTESIAEINIPHKPAKMRISPAPMETGLNMRYTFDSFVVGKSNQMAHAAAKRVAETPGRTYNPLFIYGGVGLGKTHIMHAIGNEVLQHNKGKAVVYASSEHFTNDLIAAIQHGETLKFREKYRSIDLLFIDDVQFWAGKDGTQEEFFHTFNTLYDAHKQIVVTSDRPPKEIPTLEERLVSRFEWGLVTDIQQPDLETRVAILNKKAERDNIILPEDLTFYIAKNISSNIRELEGALIRMLAFASLSNRDVNMELAYEVLPKINSIISKPITIDLIVDKVCEHFVVSHEEIVSKKRTNSVAFPRQVAMYLSRQLTDGSLNEIGNAFGGRDHTTVMHGIEKITEMIKSDPAFRAKVTDLSNYIAS